MNKQVTKYENFEPEQIKICLFENLVNDPVLFMQDIFEFLEVDSSFTPDVSCKYNPSLIPRNQFWHNFVRQPNSIKSILKLILPSKFRQNIKRNATRLYKPSFPDKIRQQLISEYQEYILKLQELTGQDFSIWMS